MPAKIFPALSGGALALAGNTFATTMTARNSISKLSALTTKGLATINWPACSLDVHLSEGALLCNAEKKFFRHFEAMHLALGYWNQIINDCTCI